MLKWQFLYSWRCDHLNKVTLTVDFRFQCLKQAEIILKGAELNLVQSRTFPGWLLVRLKVSSVIHQKRRVFFLYSQLMTKDREWNCRLKCPFFLIRPTFTSGQRSRSLVVVAFWFPFVVWVESKSTKAEWALVSCLSLESKRRTELRQITYIHKQ